MTNFGHFFRLNYPYVNCIDGSKCHMYFLTSSCFLADICSKVQGRNMVTAASLSLQLYAKRFLAASRSLRHRDEQSQYNPVQSCAAFPPVQQNRSNRSGRIKARIYVKKCDIFFISQIVWWKKNSPEHICSFPTLTLSFLLTSHQKLPQRCGDFI